MTTVTPAPWTPRWTRPSPVTSILICQPGGAQHDTVMRDILSILNTYSLNIFTVNLRYIYISTLCSTPRCFHRENCQTTTRPLTTARARLSAMTTLCPPCQTTDRCGPCMESTSECHEEQLYSWGGYIR